MASLIDLLAGAFAPQQSDASPSDQDIAVTAPLGKPANIPPVLSQPTVPSGPLSAPLNPSLGSGSQGLDYDNSDAIAAIHKVLNANQPQGGSANPGIYGLLPQSMQHGTLRNVLGALGDAFLVGSGRQAQYGPRMERQQEGDAMAGEDMNDPNSVQAAMGRVAATGAPGAAELAMKGQDQLESTRLRMAQMDYNNIQRAQMNQNRDQIRLQGMLPSIGGMLSNVNSSAQYDQLYDAIARRTKTVGQGYDPEDLGLPARGTWTPSAISGFGMTANNIQTSADRAASRVQAGRDTDVRAAATIGGANINAGRVSDAQIMQHLQDIQDQGGTLSPAQSTVWKRLTNVRGGGRSLSPGLAPSSTPPTSPNSGGGNYPTFTRAQALAASRVPGNSGKKFRIQGDPTIQVFH